MPFSVFVQLQSFSYPVWKPLIRCPCWSGRSRLTALSQCRSITTSVMITRYLSTLNRHWPCVNRFIDQTVRWRLDESILTYLIVASKNIARIFEQFAPNRNPRGPIATLCCPDVLRRSTCSIAFQTGRNHNWRRGRRVQVRVIGMGTECSRCHDTPTTTATYQPILFVNTRSLGSGHICLVT